MYTLEYKGFYIQGYTDKESVYVTGLSKQFKSELAAKLAITKIIKTAKKLLKTI